MLCGKDNESSSDPETLYFGSIMFTGIIEGMGIINSVRPSGATRRLAVTADIPLKGTKLGDSIAVNGACLTVVNLSGKRFEVDVSAETISRTTFKAVRSGERVNLERALRLSDRIDGHLVSGHIDGVGTIKDRQTNGKVTLVTISVDPALSRYTIEKGSVAVDGISLTINRCSDGLFDVTIIPHTSLMTTIRVKKIGDKVNIEADMIGKYVERFISGQEDKKPDERRSIYNKFLTKSGYL
jgi:riboflavin synthase